MTSPSRRLTSRPHWWDYPTMKVARLDEKRRLVLPGGQAGDLVAVEETGEGIYTLTRIQLPKVKRLSRAAALRAMDESPIGLSLTWEQLRSQTREP